MTSHEQEDRDTKPSACFFLVRLLWHWRIVKAFGHGLVRQEETVLGL